MRIIAIVLVAIGCGGDADAEAVRLQDACDARVCPSPAPDYIDCMPIVKLEWQPLCEDPCRTFFTMTCHIQYVE